MLDNGLFPETARFMALAYAGLAKFVLAGGNLGQYISQACISEKHEKATETPWRP